MGNQKRRLNRVMIKEELISLTGDPISAAVIEKMLYWSDVIRESDQNTWDAAETQEKIGNFEKAQELKQNLRDGWFWKSAAELHTEIMLSSKRTIERRLKKLVENGWFFRKRDGNDTHRAYWYKANIDKIRADLQSMGFALEGFPLLQESPSQRNAQNEHSPKSPPQSKRQPVAWDEPAPQSKRQSDAWDEPAPQSKRHSDASMRHSDAQHIQQSLLSTEEEYINKARVRANTTFSEIMQDFRYEKLQEIAIENQFPESLIERFIVCVYQTGVSFTRADVIQAFSKVGEDINNGQEIFDLAKWTAGKLEQEATKTQLSRSRDRVVEDRETKPGKPPFPFCDWLNIKGGSQ